MSAAAKFPHEQVLKKERDKIEAEKNRLIEVELAGNVNQIIGALESGKQLYPDWFQNNIVWVKTGQITSQAFLDSYYYLSNQGQIHAPMAEPITEEPVIEEPIIEIPELLPEVFAEEQVLADDIIQILNDIENGVILVPDWFRNNIDWVKSGHITQQEFRTAYNYLVDQQIAHPPEENLTITDNMVTQQVINFNIINGRAVGSIKFVATNNFNPHYFNKPIANIIQIKDPNGVSILTTVKQNTLNFTETERDEIINYDEDMKGNTRATIESFVWSSATTPTAFSKKFMIEISETEPPKPTTSGFMGAGIAGAIAGLILIGFIADHKVGK